MNNHLIYFLMIQLSGFLHHDLLVVRYQYHHRTNIGISSNNNFSHSIHKCLQIKIIFFFFNSLRRTLQKCLSLIWKNLCAWYNLKSRYPICNHYSCSKSVLLELHKYKLQALYMLLTLRTKNFLVTFCLLSILKGLEQS